VIAGPNGNGKSSLFDVFLKYLDLRLGAGGLETHYHLKTASQNKPLVEVSFHEGQSLRKAGSRSTSAPPTEMIRNLQPVK
jgi:hypothetical protein